MGSISQLNETLLCLYLTLTLTTDLHLACLYRQPFRQVANSGQLEHEREQDEWQADIYLVFGGLFTNTAFLYTRFLGIIFATIPLSIVPDCLLTSITGLLSCGIVAVLTTVLTLKLISLHASRSWTQVTCSTSRINHTEQGYGRGKAKRG